MNLKIIQKIINSKKIVGIYEDINIVNIKTNSKEIKEGDLFLTINSGYLYIEDAISNGASAIITDVDNLTYDIPTLVVDNTKKALKSLASYYRSQYKGIVIAITGSNGKTTTKELLKYVLSKKNKVLANDESKNNILGVSNTLLNLSNNYDYLILELGMNHKGEISELSNLVKPDIGIITNIGTSHIGYLGSQDNIFKAKLELLDGNPNMKLFVNGSDKYLKGVSATKVEPVNLFNHLHPISTSIVLTIYKYLGYDEETAEELMKNFSGVKSRMQHYYIKDHLVIDDAYNASYESFVNGLENLKQYDNRKIIIFGDMLELGKYSTYYHQKVLDKVKELDNVIIITVGTETAILNNVYHFYELELLKNFFKNFNWYDDDIVYMKASHKINLSSIIPFFEDLW